MQPDPEYDFADTDPTPAKKRIAYAIGGLWLVAVVAGLRAAGVV